MPEISRFYGIVVKVFAGDHPPPHFHVVYGEYNALFSIQTLGMIEGDVPIRVKKMVTEWANLHKDELMNMWDTQQFHKVTPLK